MHGKFENLERVLADEDVLTRHLSRRQFVAGVGATSFGLLLAGCGGGGGEEKAAQTTKTTAKGEGAPLKKGLASGMYGGPTGFDGAERYQYPFDSEEGRAIAGLRRLRKDGKAPDTLVVQVLNFARPQFERGFPQGAPSILDVFEEETGIKVKFVETDPASEYQVNLRNASTKNGSFDLVTDFMWDLGDFAEAGLLRPLDEFVHKYKPQWRDPKYGYLGGDTTVRIFTQYKGETYAVAFDNDTQPFVYRSDLFNNQKEKAAFEDKYGRALEFPKTWEDQAQVAEFFTRPNANPPLYGSVERKGPFWGWVNWQQRFVSSAAPNMYYFNEDGSANVNNEAGIRALEEHVRSLEFSEPGTLTKDWLAQYQLFGRGSGVMGGTFPNVTKLVVPANRDLDKGFGKFLRTDVQPGREVDGKLIRRPVIFSNISYSVNAFAPKKHHEAAYLFLQWAGGARVYTWLAANPGGYQDPHHTISLEDPLVIRSYQPEPTNALKSIIPRTAPPIRFRGAGQYHQALDEELQKALTKQQSPARAMKRIADRWDRITERLGTEGQVEAIKADRGAWPDETGPDKTLGT
jgi:multiple sugar transport system substrate-binding protein